MSITVQNRLVIEREAFCSPAFADLIKMLRERVEAMCQSNPDETLDRVVIELDYGVVKPDAPAAQATPHAFPVNGKKA